MIVSQVREKMQRNRDGIEKAREKTRWTKNERGSKLEDGDKMKERVSQKREFGLEEKNGQRMKRYKNKKVAKESESNPKQEEKGKEEQRNDDGECLNTFHLLHSKQAIASKSNFKKKGQKTDFLSFFTVCLFFGDPS